MPARRRNTAHEYTDGFLLLRHRDVRHRPGAAGPGGRKTSGGRAKKRHVAARRQSDYRPGDFDVSDPVRLHERGHRHVQRTDDQNAVQLRHGPGTVYEGGFRTQT